MRRWVASPKHPLSKARGPGAPLSAGSPCQTLGFCLCIGCHTCLRPWRAPLVYVYTCRDLTQAFA